MATSRIPKDVAAAINECWPDGVVEPFATDESYFPATHPRLEQDLRNIRGGSLLWQTEEEIAAGWDIEKDEPPSSDGWQSYHVFFLSPDGEAFHLEDETAGIVEPEDPQPDAETDHPGEGWIGCAIGVCLAAPYAVINLCSYWQYEDGTMSAPDVESFIYSDDTSERVDTDQYHREILSQEAFQRLEALRRELASILAKHGIQVLGKRVLDLPVPGLKAGEDVFLEEPLRVQDAFFLRGE